MRVMDKKEKQKRVSYAEVVRWGLFVVLVMYCLVMIIALCWGMSTSLKSQREYSDNRLWFPGKLYFGNYKSVLQAMIIEIENSMGFVEVGIGTMYINSILYAVGGAFIQTFITALVAYLTVRFPYKFSKIVYNFVIFTLSLKIVGSLPSEIQLATNLGLIDSMLGMYVMKAHFLGVYYLVMHAAMSGIPNTYFEAAKIDGAGNFWLLFKIALPLIKGVFFTIFMLYAISYWNDYQTPMIFLKNYPTMSYAVYYFSFKSTGTFARVPVRMTTCMFLLLPMLVLYLTCSKYLLKGVGGGGIKE